MAEEIIYRIKVEDQFSATFEKLNDSVSDTESWFSRLASSAYSYFSSISSWIWEHLKKASEVIIEFVTDAVQHWLKFEQALTLVARTVGLNNEEFDDMGEALRDLSLNILQAGIDAEELATIAGIAGQLGISGTANILEFTRVVGMMAATTNLSAEQAATAMAQLLNLFNLDLVSNVERLASTIDMLGNTTTATQSQIAEVMRRMGGTAAFFGMTADQTAAWAATIRDAGVTVRVGGTALTQFMARVGQDYEKFAQVLGLNANWLRFQLEQGQVSEALMDILRRLNELKSFKGKLPVIAMLKELSITGVGLQDTLLKMSGATDKLTKNLSAAAKEWKNHTTMQEEYETILGRVNIKLNRLWMWWDEIKKQIGGPVAKAIGDFTDTYLTPFIKDLSAWIRENETIQKFLKEDLPALLTTAGEYLEGLRKSIFGGNTERTWVNDVLDYFRAKWTQFKSWIMGTWKQITTYITDKWTELKKEFFDALASVETFFIGIGEQITQVAGNIDQLIASLQNIINSVEGLMEIVRYPKSVASEFFKNLLPSFLDPGEVTKEFKEMTEAENESDRILRMMTRDIAALEEASKSFGNTMTGNSVLPDLVHWLGISTVKVHELTAAMQQTAVTAQQLTTFSTPRSPSPIGFYDQMFSSFQQRLNPAPSFIAQTVPTGTPQQAVIVNFNGMNIVDDYSMENAVKKITEVQSRLGRRVIA